MWIENAADNTYVLYTPVDQEPELQRQLKIINEIVADRDDCYVIISLADIEILTSSSISCLLALHNSLSENGRLLILCKVGLPVKGIFRITHLSSVFNFAVDMLAAQTMIQKTKHPEIQTTAC
ncbi:MAG: STAS domain-containing protein [Planctomycetota bacterium]|jgi:anti-anti-sigma factor